MRTEIVTLTASVLINAGALLAVDHAVVHRDLWIQAGRPERMVERGADALNFEFVESPPAPVPHPPKKTRRISNRDALNRDLTKHKSSADGVPRAKVTGLADQLAQHEKTHSTPPSQASPETAPKSPAKEEKVEIEKPRAPQDNLKTSGAETEKITDTTLVTESTAQAVPPSAPRTAVPGVSGQDRITISEVSRLNSHGAQMTGATSFEATGSGMGQYMKNLKEKIWMAWFPYLMVHYPKDFKTADALLSITLDATGQVKEVRLLEKKGSALFAAFCMESVRRAGSFGPLPREILDLAGKDELDIKFAFHYW